MFVTDRLDKVTQHPQPRRNPIRTALFNMQKDHGGNFVNASRAIFVSFPDNTTGTPTRKSYRKWEMTAPQSS
jgi:hypothetical protein